MFQREIDIEIEIEIKVQRREGKEEGGERKRGRRWQTGKQGTSGPCWRGPVPSGQTGKQRSSQSPFEHSLLARYLKEGLFCLPL